MVTRTLHFNETLNSVNKFMCDQMYSEYINFTIIGLYRNFIISKSPLQNILYRNIAPTFVCTRPQITFKIKLNFDL